MVVKTTFKYTYLNALRSGGAKQDRTADLLNANQALSQLSYSPIGITNSMLVHFLLNQGKGSRSVRVAHEVFFDAE